MSQLPAFGALTDTQTSTGTPTQTHTNAHTCFFVGGEGGGGDWEALFTTDRQLSWPRTNSLRAVFGTEGEGGKKGEARWGDGSVICMGPAVIYPGPSCHSLKPRGSFLSNLPPLPPSFSDMCISTGLSTVNTPLYVLFGVDMLFTILFGP